MFTLFLKALLLTTIIEILGAWGFLTWKKITRGILWFVLIGNFITLPIVWFVFPALKTYYLFIIVSELFAFIFEAFFIFLFNKKLISLKQSLQLSLIANSLSFFIGNPILRLVAGL